MWICKKHKKCFRIYTTWVNIKQRCCNKNSKKYLEYGAKGISMCDEWKNSFENFYTWAMANGYTDSLTIDRIDNSKGYFPDNCRFVTQKDQAINRNVTVFLTAFGETKTVSDWARDSRSKFSRSEIRRRMLNSNMSPEDILTKTKVVKRGHSLTAFGETKNIQKWSKDSRCCVKYSTLYARFIDKKMSPEEMLTLPPQR